MDLNQKISVKVTQIEPVRGAALRMEGEPTPEKAGLLWGRLLQRCRDAPSAGPAFGLRREDAYEACWAVPPGVPLPDGLAETEAPGGWYAVAVQAGAYDQLGGTVKRILEEWLPHGGFRRREGPIVERYLNDPRETPEADLRTEVCIPVQPDPIE